MITEVLGLLRDNCGHTARMTTVHCHTCAPPILTSLYHAAKLDALAEDHRDSHITILKEGYAVIERLLGGDPSDSIVDRIQDLQRRVAEARTGYHAAKIAGKIEALTEHGKARCQTCAEGHLVTYSKRRGWHHRIAPGAKWPCLADTWDALAALKSAQEEGRG